MAVIDRLLTIFCEEKDSMAKAIIHGVAIEAGGVGLFTAQIPADRFVIGGMNKIFLWEEKI